MQLSDAVAWHESLAGIAASSPNSEREMHHREEAERNRILFEENRAEWEANETNFAAGQRAGEHAQEQVKHLFLAAAHSSDVDPAEFVKHRLVVVQLAAIDGKSDPTAAVHAEFKRLAKHDNPVIASHARTHPQAKALDVNFDEDAAASEKPAAEGADRKRTR